MKVILVGCGSISRRWIEAIEFIEEAELVCLVDINLNSADKIKNDNKLKIDISNSLNAALDEYYPDVILDCTTPDARFDIVSNSLRKGAHVLSEKPVALNISEAEKLIAISNESNRHYAVMQNRRYDPNAETVKKLLDSEIIGKLTTINCDFYKGCHFGGFRDKMEHVLLKDMAIHTFDIARYFSGLNMQKTFCYEWNPSGSWYQHGASSVAVFIMGNDVVFNYRGSWCSEGQETAWESKWQFIGEKGSIEWDGAASLLLVRAAESGNFINKKEEKIYKCIYDNNPVKWHYKAIQLFFKSIKNGEIPDNISFNNIKSFYMVESAIKSSKEKKMINNEGEYAN